MANPKRRQSRSRRDKRRANWKLEAPNYTKCTQCGELVMPHRACSKCGFYSGEVAVLIKAKSEQEDVEANVANVETQQAQPEVQAEETKKKVEKVEEKADQEQPEEETQETNETSEK